MIQGSVTVGYMDPGKWSACFGMSLRDLFMYDANHGCGRVVAELRTMVGAGGLADGRNHIVEQFLEGDAEWLFFIDSDMGFAADTVDRLVESSDAVESPVMGGLCFQLYQQQASSFHGIRNGIMPTLYEYIGFDGFQFIPDYKRDSIQRVDATGAACLLVHRSVLEKIQSHWFSTMFQYSEDMSFMRRCANLDIPIYVNSAVKTTHDKGALFLDEDLYVRSRPWAEEDE